MPSHGVSCESCHGPAEPWIRSHTRPDFTTADRVASGMRDLKNLYVRANTCVACHQTLDSDLAAAGHPELHFELDGQCVSQPRHWKEAESYSGPQAWLVGQAVALREMSWQLTLEKNETLLARWSGLLWTLQQLGALHPEFPDLISIPVNRPEADHFHKTQKLADQLAWRAAELPSTEVWIQEFLGKMLGAFPQFRATSKPQMTHARRAEHLVLGLDRLAIRLPESQAKALNPEINHLYKLCQSLPAFDPKVFSTALEKTFLKAESMGLIRK